MKKGVVFLSAAMLGLTCSVCCAISYRETDGFILGIALGILSSILFGVGIFFLLDEGKKAELLRREEEQKQTDMAHQTLVINFELAQKKFDEVGAALEDFQDNITRKCEAFYSQSLKMIEGAELIGGQLEQVLTATQSIENLNSNSSQKIHVMLSSIKEHQNEAFGEIYGTLDEKSSNIIEVENAIAEKLGELSEITTKFQELKEQQQNIKSSICDVVDELIETQNNHMKSMESVMKETTESYENIVKKYSEVTEMDAKLLETALGSADEPDM